MKVKSRHSAIPKVKVKKIWAPQPIREIFLFPEKKLTSIFGTMLEMKARSMRESWLSRKYMEVWRWGSAQMRRIKVVFPVIAMV